MAIGKNSRIHIVAIDGAGKRLYLNTPATKRNNRGELVLWPVWSDEPAYSRPLSYEHALIVKRRMAEEHKIHVHFALQAGDTAELIEQ
jgi:hypothetical protein